MFNTFDNCISHFSKESEPSDYWYDCAIIESINMLEQFNDDDWHLLLEQIKNKPTFWQKRLVECLGDLHNRYELDVILAVINTTNNDLFIDCVDSLRCLDLSILDNYQKKKLLSRVETSLIKANPLVKLVLDDFIIKLNK